MTDEFIEPTVIGDYDGVAADEPVIFINFRPDRARQLTMALGDPAFAEFDRGSGPALEVTTMTEYRDGWPYPVAFPPQEPETTLAEVIAERGERQLHVAETEKYAHVTYFFNGGREQEWERGGARARRLAARRPHLRPQARDERRRGRPAVQPSTGARTATASGSSTSPTPTWSATPASSRRRSPRSRRSTASSPRSSPPCTSQAGACIVTADHGNAEQMLEPDGSPNTAHSTNPVPPIVTVAGRELRDGGILADVAPTVLDLLGIPQPEAMTGRSLLA